MAAVLGTNIASIWASKNLQTAQSNMASSVERLSSGLRINRGKDDAAGLAIANTLTQQINGANQGIKNLNDGVSIVQTADGALAAVAEMAQRLVTIGTQASSGVLSTEQYAALKTEADGLLAAMDNIVTRTKFSGTALFGALADITISSSNETGDTIVFDKTTALVDFKDDAPTITTLADIEDGQSLADDAGTFLVAISTQRATLGSLQNQLEFAINNVTDLSSNLTAARSRVIDTDYASETASLTKGQILQQAATAMLAQANQMPNVILSLLK
jgi:flagellin